MSERETAPLRHATWSDYRAAARSVRASPRAATVLKSLRPRDTTRILYARGPLPLALYIADCEERLVWRGPDEFAVLQTPLGLRTRYPLPASATVCRWLDSNWGIAVFAATPALLELLSLAVALAIGSLLVAVCVLLLALLFVSVALSIGVAHPMLARHRLAPGEAAVGTAVWHHWSLVLLHDADAHTPGRMLEDVLHRLHRLIARDVQDSARDIGGHAESVRVHDTLVCLASGVTTEPVLRWLVSRADADVPFGPGSELIMLAPQARTDDVSPRLVYIPFFRLFAASVAALIALIPLAMVDWEKSACHDYTCPTALLTYGRALHWLAYQFLWRDVPGLAPSSVESTGMGFLVHFLLPVTVLVGVVSARTLTKNHRTAIRRAEQERRRTVPRVLIMSVKAEERNAVLAGAERITGRRAQRDFTGHGAVYELGTIGGARVSLVQAGEQGVGGPAGAMLTASAAIRQIKPDYAIITGICYGLYPKEQKLCDVLVSQRVRDLNLAGVRDVAGSVVSEDRGENVQGTHVLLDRCHAAEQDWDRTRVHIGEMLAWTTKVDSNAVVHELRQRYPRAVGGEMEGAGFHAAARRAGVEWIVVKAISDWGYRTTNRYHVEAATNAADFVLHMIDMGGLRTKPTDLLG
ncbi:hypothetical protein [Labedaea rhizosphaerae]|uniref:Nucleoside phosphorylase n=1 Tax=Labedaea rhizosphaerae TaxID=598644 RepID=A0A4R6S1Q5_LABRH|nr:hypothetical protein [Labedaea rhizosphaerae]TDP92917.1 nucleoside phosphorylase [Labedaea rhizosphaerae]